MEQIERSRKFFTQILMFGVNNSNNGYKQLQVTRSTKLFTSIRIIVLLTNNNIAGTSSMYHVT